MICCGLCISPPFSLECVSNYTVHGFANVSYTVVEAEQLTTTFGPNVKGNSPLGANIGGEIIAEAGNDTTRMFLLFIIVHI